MNDCLFDPLSSDPDSHALAYSLARRMELFPQLIRRQQEEFIIDLVSLTSDWVDSKKTEFLEGEDLHSLLASRNWTEKDLNYHLAREEALHQFSSYRFGPGLEEYFLQAQGGHDQIIYSILRVRDPGLAQELWIRFEEHESTFAELASMFGEGPEASRKGLIGPVPIGSISPPELIPLLRTLQTSEVHPPHRFGDWFVLLRLEQITPARLDDNMRKFLLNQQLNAFLDARVDCIMKGVTPEVLEFDYQS